MKSLEGQVFGRLTVVRFAHRDKFKKPCWFCKCECGREHVASANNLQRGNVTSCGCLRPHHGQASGNGTAEYRIWKNMLSRCTNPKLERFRHYGGRGITVCARWQSFSNFFADMGPRPTQRHSIDRYPNKDGNYEPGNVRWATPSEQGRNQRSNKVLEYRGIVLCETDWCHRLGVTPGTISKRLRNGWPLSRALTVARQENA
jgi:hypothetical protein